MSLALTIFLRNELEVAKGEKLVGRLTLQRMPGKQQQTTTNTKRSPTARIARTVDTNRGREDVFFFRQPEQWPAQGSPFSCSCFPSDDPADPLALGAFFFGESHRSPPRGSGPASSIMTASFHLGKQCQRKLRASLEERRVPGCGATTATTPRARPRRPPGARQSASSVASNSTEITLSRFRMPLPGILH